METLKMTYVRVTMTAHELVERVTGHHLTLTGADLTVGGESLELSPNSMVTLEYRHAGMEELKDNPVHGTD